ncbi:MAG: hypothetical protein C0467_20805 [Planctomycetaceae bacterium]|nr:hypothetical protein [Planctomycetaceae bacterium]
MSQESGATEEFSVGLGFEGRPRAGESLDRPDPRAAYAEDVGDLAGGHPLVGEGDDAVAELDG